MEKVKLTREQVEEIEEIKRVGIPCTWKYRGWEVHRDEAINKLSLDEFMRAIYVGCEVEPEFEKGQWIYDITDENKTVIEVAYVTDIRVHGFWKTKHSDIDTHVVIENARHFTKEEIAEEKERRWWDKHDRNVWKLKPEDVIIDRFNRIREVHADDGDTVSFLDGHTVSKNYVKDTCKIVCFFKDRKDV